MSTIQATTATALALLTLLATGCQTAPPAAEAAPKAVAAKSLPAGQVQFAPGSPQLAQIKVEAVASAEVPTDEVTSPGKVEANPNRTSHVTLPLAGRIVTVSVKIGDLVQQGQPLLMIDSPDVDAALSAQLQSLAQITQAKSVVTKTQADLERVRDLFSHDAVAKKEVLNAEAMLTQSQAALEQTQAGAQQSRRRLELLGIEPGRFGQKVAVTAPISGKVLEMNIVPGEYRNDTSAPVMTITDLSTVWITSDVPESSIRLVKLGEAVQIDLAAYPGEKFRGRVKQIADTVDPQTRTIKVRAEMDNPAGRLRPEMFGQIRHVEALENKPVVPASAVIEADNRRLVWRETAPGQFQRTAVTLGGRIGDRVAIQSGLKAGDRIVIDGVMLLQSN
ncbi:MAG: efflux RND transporter periplasmic adaptor subunit [Acidobacteria bacterium]|nr:efflux RND transporter periplasmic adaptor subunit [Acidobacteriota bacterium]